MGKVADAHKVMDGIIAIAEREMLLHGDYVTGVVDEALRRRGTICGGRQACFLGSALLAIAPRRAARTFDEGFGHIYCQTLRTRPGLRLAMETADEVVGERMGERLECVTQPGRFAELYFEQVLGTAGRLPDKRANADTRREVIDLCREVKGRLPEEE